MAPGTAFETDNNLFIQATRVALWNETSFSISNATVRYIVGRAMSKDITNPTLQIENTYCIF